MIILLLIFFFWVVGLPIGVDLSIELKRFTSLSNLPKPVKLPGWKFSAESDLFSGNGSDLTDFLLTTLLPPFSGCSASWLTPTLKKIKGAWSEFIFLQNQIMRIKIPNGLKKPLNDSFYLFLKSDLWATFKSTNQGPSVE